MEKEMGVLAGIRVVRTTPQRVVLGIAGISFWSGALILLVRVTDSPIVAVIAGPFFMLPLSSMWEWLVHQYLYHRRLPGLEKINLIHNAGHHGKIFPPTRYVQDGPYEHMRFRGPMKPWRLSDTWLDNKLGSWSQVLLHFVVGVPAILAPAWLLTEDVFFAGSSLVSLCIISWLLAYVHGSIHTPRDRLIEHMAWFQWLDRHHYIHHIDYAANLNFMMPICDVVFGSLKTELTDVEKGRFPSFEEAKPMAKDVVQQQAYEAL
jgi:hypothetical protein